MNAAKWIARKLSWRGLAALGVVLLLALLWQTWAAQRPFPDSLNFQSAAARKLQIQDRHSQPLTVTYQNRWNLHDYRPLHEIPQTLQDFFILAEDQRFYRHGGVDWLARLHALAQNLKAGRIVRGASTLTEQAVRILHPRPRTFWSRWVETVEAMRLEARFSKADILEFYLNQIDYVGRRRGVASAARHYFDRDLDTLNQKEMMALAVLVRSPSRMDLRHGNKSVENPIRRLGERLLQQGLLDSEGLRALLAQPLQLQQRRLPVQATHFVQHLYRHAAELPSSGGSVLRTSLDARLQHDAQRILEQRLADLRARDVHNGALLIVDHQTNEVRAWVNSGDFFSDLPGSQIDAITTPRQPGSTLKPLLYALALEKGWTAATLIEDAPLAESVGSGLHDYQNYSRSFYGPLRLRDALGNSLNTPAVRTAQYVGAADFLATLRQLGIRTLEQHPNFYGDGLALGNGGVSLFELVQAYTALARQGLYQPLRLLPDSATEPARRVFSAETASLIGHILSDPDARRLEFGSGSLLRFPVQTAVKTGTSNDYHDAWAIGFNHRYLVGVWLGNLDQQPMRQVSGATGPALVLRSLFAELNRHQETRPLYFSPRLRKLEICRVDGRLADGRCASREEWFAPGDEPAPLLARAPLFQQAAADAARLRQPTPNLQLALDPRIPDRHEAFLLQVTAGLAARAEQIEWLIDEETVGITEAGRDSYLWPLQRGKHRARARVWLVDSDIPLETPAVAFQVK